MRTTTWYYLRAGSDGAFRSIPAKQIRAFQAGEHPLPADGDGFVRYVQLYVQWEEHRPSALYGSEFLKFLVQPDGLFDQNGWATRVASVLSDSYLDLSEYAAGQLSNLIDASPRFAERRYRHLTTWQPSQKELSALSQLVRKRLQKALTGKG